MSDDSAKLLQFFRRPKVSTTAAECAIIPAAAAAADSDAETNAETNAAAVIGGADHSEAAKVYDSDAVSLVASDTISTTDKSEIQYRLTVNSNTQQLHSLPGPVSLSCPNSKVTVAPIPRQQFNRLQSGSIVAHRVHAISDLNPVPASPKYAHDYSDPSATLDTEHASATAATVTFAGNVTADTAATIDNAADVVRAKMTHENRVWNDARSRLRMEIRQQIDAMGHTLFSQLSTEQQQQMIQGIVRKFCNSKLYGVILEQTHRTIIATSKEAAIRETEKYSQLFSGSTIHVMPSGSISSDLIAPTSTNPSSSSSYLRPKQSKMVHTILTSQERIAQKQVLQQIAQVSLQSCELDTDKNAARSLQRSLIGVELSSRMRSTIWKAALNSWKYQADKQLDDSSYSSAAPVANVSAGGKANQKSGLLSSLTMSSAVETTRIQSTVETVVERSGLLSSYVDEDVQAGAFLESLCSMVWTILNTKQTESKNPDSATTSAAANVKPSEMSRIGLVLSGLLWCSSEKQLLETHHDKWWTEQAHPFGISNNQLGVHGNENSGLNSNRPSMGNNTTSKTVCSETQSRAQVSASVELISSYAHAISQAWIMSDKQVDRMLLFRCFGIDRESKELIPPLAANRFAKPMLAGVPPSIHASLFGPSCGPVSPWSSPPSDGVVSEAPRLAALQSAHMNTSDLNLLPPKLPRAIGFALLRVKQIDFEAFEAIRFACFDEHQKMPFHFVRNLFNWVAVCCRNLFVGVLSKRTTMYLWDIIITTRGEALEFLLPCILALCSHEIATWATEFDAKEVVTFQNLNASDDSLRLLHDQGAPAALRQRLRKLQVEELQHLVHSFVLQCVTVVESDTQ
jgi:hypothetical protein